jgi:hypothetical protein
MDLNDDVIHSCIDDAYHHATVIRYKEAVVVFAMDAERRLHYAVLDVITNEGVAALVAAIYQLKHFTPLTFSSEIASARGADAEAAPFSGDTGQLTADAPFQALTDGDYICLFRQSASDDHETLNHTLLLDRYRLDVAASALIRSDEPTYRLDFIRHLQGGRFNALLLPTSEGNSKRWQFFAYNSQTERIDAFNFKRSENGLFDLTVESRAEEPNAPGRTEAEESTQAEDAGVNTANGNHGKIYGTTCVLGAAIEEHATYLEAETALRFRDTADYLNCGRNLDLQETDFTIEFWAKRSPTTGSNQYAMGQGPRTGRDGLLHIGFRESDRFTFAFGDNDALDTPEGQGDDDWRHWACTYNRTTKRRVIYCDGELLIEDTAEAPYATAGTFWIGKAPWGDGFKGDIDEVRVWRCVRTAEEIKADMGRRLVGDEDGLAAYWRFDEGRGNRARDQTDNGHDGTLYGNADDDMWVASTAPVSERLGLSRSSFAFAGRNVAAGLSSLLYQMGTDGKGGNASAVTRLLLSTATGGPDVDGNASDQTYAAILDFPVTPKGTLGQVADVIALPQLTGDASAQLRQIAQAQQAARNALSGIAAGFVEQAAFSASEQRPYAYFGGAVALSSEWAMAGSRHASPDGIERAGRVDVFHLENGVWTHKQTLVASDKGFDDSFGVSIGMSGEWAVVGAYQKSADGIEYAGGAYLFHLEADAWVEKQQLAASDAAAEAYFGVSVTISGNALMVGSDGGAGRAYVFALENGRWSEKQTLTASDAQDNSGFGGCIALDGEWAIAGAFQARVDRVDGAGCAYVFHYENGVWTETQKLVASHDPVKASFGSAVDLHGEWAIIGADQDDADEAPSAGRAYIFRRNKEGVWGEPQLLDACDVQAGAHFGGAVAIGSAAAMVGARGAASDTVAQAGSVYIFQPVAGIWRQTQKLTARDAQAHAYFSNAVALSGDRALVGAYRAAANGAAAAGCSYLFDSALAAQVTQLEKVLEQIGQHEQNLGQVGQSLSVVHSSSAGREVHGGLVRLAPVEGTPSLVDAATGKALWPALLVNSAPGWTSLATLKVAVHTDSGWVFSVKPESH